MFLDFFGTLASLFATYFFIRLDKKAWIISLFATLANSWLYWQKGIYADMLLELFYFLSTCYGWYLWRLPPKSATKVITALSSKQGLLLAGIIISMFLIIAGLLFKYTNSDIIFLDALTTSLSLAAQLLMCYKMIATWILWFITDAIYAYMYLDKQIPFHCLLMVIYTLMAIIGYRTWNKLRHRDEVKSGYIENLQSNLQD